MKIERTVLPRTGQCQHTVMPLLNEGQERLHLIPPYSDVAVEERPVENKVDVARKWCG